MNDLDKVTLVSDKAIASTLKTVSTLGEIGKKTLDSAGEFLDYLTLKTNSMLIDVRHEVGNDACFAHYDFLMSSKIKLT